MAEKKMTERIGKDNYVGAGLILLQDCGLSGAASLMSILLVRWLSEPISGFTGMVLAWLGLAVAATALGSLFTGSHKVVRRWATFRSSYRLITTVVFKESVLILVLILGWISMPSPALSVLSVLSDTMLSLLLLMYIRFAARMFSKSEVQKVKQAASRKNALVYGTGSQAIALARGLEAGTDFNLVGFITDDESMGGRVIGNTIVYVCKDNEDLRRLEWRLGGIDCVFLAKELAWKDSSASPQNDTSHEHPHTCHADRDNNCHAERSEASISEASIVKDGMGTAGQTLKRAFDIVLSSVLMLIFSPMALISAIAVKLEDGGPILYSQERIGRGGRPFHILKFRSMRTDAEAAGAQLYAGDSDPRLTRVGAFLRKHHLDELPQLWNVLRGDMSFIGYRPERQVYIRQIMEHNPRYRYLYQIRPGVTSYATLYNGYTDTLEKMLTRLDLDLYYLRHHSILFDARVLGLTFLNIVSGKKF